MRSFINRDWDNDFGSCHRNINTAWLVFKSILNEGVKKFIPCISSQSWKRKSSWKRPISSDFIALILKKHRLWTRFCETRNLKYESEYKRVRNAVKKESRKRIYKETLSLAKNCKENP